MAGRIPLDLEGSLLIYGQLIVFGRLYESYFNDTLFIIIHADILF